MIISGAENIYPREVETVLARHPAVEEVAVFGIPDPVFGEKVCAAIVVRSGAQVSEQELEEFCLENIARYKRPRVFEFHSELPKNSAGKIAKTKLREAHLVSPEPAG
jgi:acyl-CoA synthetase (AMP-forming)/AMP-acid ligase II